MGQGDMALLDEGESLQLPAWDPGESVAVLTQTTLSVDDTARAIAHVREKFPEALIRNDICYATTNRQESLKVVAERVDVVLVIGAQNSSNCERLREVAQASGVPAYLVNGPDEIDMTWFEGVTNVGITSGASTPEVMVQAVIDLLNPQNVFPIGEREEDITFVLPRQLRDSAGADD